MTDDFLPHPVRDPDEELLCELEVRSFHDGMYHEFTVPKASGGLRRILAPNRKLMPLLRRLLALLQARQLPGSTSAHGYYFGRSILTMAQPHLQRRVVVKLDLSDFFPTITAPMVNDALARRDVPYRLRRVVTKWCFHQHHLPIGAPTSPLLSNLVAADLLDHRLRGLIDGWHRSTNYCAPAAWRFPPIYYTRYADDLVFSSDYIHLPKIVPALRRVIHETPFRVNEKKIRILQRSRRQAVCGVVVNQTPGVARSTRRDLAHELYRCVCDLAVGRCPPGRRIQRLAADGLSFEEAIPFESLAGRIAHVAWLKPSHAGRLHALYRLLLDLHRPEAERLPSTRNWCAAVRQRQEPAACSPTSNPESASLTASSTETSSTS